MSFAPECKMIPISRINANGRLRQADANQVEAIRSSLIDVGLINPITVCSDADGFRLVAGLHRLEAFKAEGWEEIQAVILDLSDLEMQIAECDENLCGPVLTPIDRARFIARRKEAYEAIHGPAKAIGAAAANASMGHTDANANLAVASFSADTAAKTRLSERAVQREAERGERVAEEVDDLIRGTHLDTGVFLDRIKKLSPTEQLEVAKRELAAGRPARSHTGSSPTDASSPSSAEFNPMQVRAFDPSASTPEHTAEKPADPLPSADEMRAELLMLSRLSSANFLQLCEPRKRASMCSLLAHLIETFERVREEVGA